MGRGEGSFRGEAKHKIGEVSVPVDLTMNHYGNTVAEYFSCRTNCRGVMNYQRLVKAGPYTVFGVPLESL